MKYIDTPVSTKIIPEIEKKCQLLKIPSNYTLEKALVSKKGASPALIDTEYFDHYLQLNDYF